MVRMQPGLELGWIWTQSVSSRAHSISTVCLFSLTTFSQLTLLSLISCLPPIPSQGSRQAGWWKGAHAGSGVISSLLPARSGTTTHPSQSLSCIWWGAIYSSGIHKTTYRRLKFYHSRFTRLKKKFLHLKKVPSNMEPFWALKKKWHFNPLVKYWCWNTPGIHFEWA